MLTCQEQHMDHEELQHQEDLLRSYRRRLRILEQQEALLGIRTPPEILLEIEDLRNKIVHAELEPKQHSFTPETPSNTLNLPLSVSEAIQPTLSSETSPVYMPSTLLMGRGKSLRIVRVPLWSWKKRLTVFASIFGFTWLFLEPLAAFSDSPFLSTSGIWGYIFLVLFAALLTFSIQVYGYSRIIGRMSFCSFDIILTESGVRYSIEAPLDMRVEEFLNLFFDRVARDADPNSSLSRANMYDKVMLVKRSEKYEEIEGQKTIREVGLREGDECRIRGTIKQQHRLAFWAIGRKGGERVEFCLPEPPQDKSNSDTSKEESQKYKDISEELRQNWTSSEMTKNWQAYWQGPAESSWEMNSLATMSVTSVSDSASTTNAPFTD
jgi:hypothetical protein